MEIKAAFLDIDGTLVDSNEFHVTAWERAFQERLHPVERAQIRQQIGKGADMLIPTLAPELSASDRQSVAALQGHIFQSGYLRQVRAFPGARELIVALHDRGTKVVLASSASQAEVDHYIELLEVEGLIAATTCADDVKKTKPAEDIFRSALAKVTPLLASEVVVIGDTPYDAQAARKAGMAVIAVRSGGFSDSALREAGASVLYDGVGDLLRHFDESRSLLRPARKGS